MKANDLLLENSPWLKLSKKPMIACHANGSQCVTGTEIVSMLSAGKGFKKEFCGSALGFEDVFGHNCQMPEFSPAVFVALNPTRHIHWRRDIVSAKTQQNVC